MIWSWIFQIIFDVLNYFLGKLDPVSTSGGFATAMGVASTLISMLYTMFPLIILTALGILVFDTVFESGYLLFKAIYWVIRRFPTQS